MFRPQSHEEITWQGQIASILALTETQIALRLLCWIIIPIAWAILTGRMAGPILILAAWVIAADPRLDSLAPRFEVMVRTGKLKRERANKAVVAFFLGLALTILWLTGYWPGISWELGSGRLWLIWATGSDGFGPLWLWLRFAVIVAVPLLIIEPLQATDWALAIEKLWPKAREAQSANFSPGSKAVRKARHGMRLDPTTSGGGSVTVTQQQQEEAEPHPADTTQTMRVDGV